MYYNNFLLLCVRQPQQLITSPSPGAIDSNSVTVLTPLDTTASDCSESSTLITTSSESTVEVSTTTCSLAMTNSSLSPSTTTTITTAPTTTDREEEQFPESLWSCRGNTLGGNNGPTGMGVERESPTAILAERNSPAADKALASMFGFFEETLPGPASCVAGPTPIGLQNFVITDSGVKNETEATENNSEPDFPHSKLAMLDEKISSPRWVVPVLPEQELECLLQASIELCKKGLDVQSEACQRFFREGLTISFTKILTDDAVTSWKYNIHHCIFQNCERLVELCVVKLSQDWFPLLDLLAMVFNPNNK